MSQTQSNENYFKKYARDNRVQNTDATFKNGMLFTKAPLAAGSARMLVNFDIISDGASLSTRRGIHTSEVALAFSSTTLRPALTDPSVKLCKDVIQEDNESYRLAVAADYSDEDTQVANTNLYEAPAELWVVHGDVNEDIPCLDEYDMSCKEMYALNMSKQTDDTNTRKSYYYLPKVDNVNGFEYTNRKGLARPIGCFAWDGNYYNFNNNKELIRSRYAVASGSTLATFYTEKLTAKEITPAMAVTNGFNMLSEDPYTFSDATQSGNMVMNGLLIYSGSTLIAEPLLGQSYKYRAFYSAEAGKKYKVVFSYRGIDEVDYTTISTKEYTIASTPQEISCNFSCAVSDIMFKAEAFYYDTSTSAYEEDAQAFFTVEVTYSEKTTTANRDLPNYDLSKAGNMMYWNNCIWLYGFAEAPNTLIHSYYNEPTYFPYPKNSQIFQDPVRLCIPFNEKMLVFTTTQLIQVTASDGSYTYKVIQSNLNFTDFDVSLVQIVKNMVFFKSGDYYYMVVPKTLSLQNELAIAPVSKNIEQFLDDFQDNVADLFETLYDYSSDKPLKLVNHFNFLNYEDVNNIYTFETYDDSTTPQPTGMYINLDLMYNTIDRTWRLYTFESQDMFNIIRQDATRVGTYYCPLKAKFNESDVETSTVGLQFLETCKSESDDFYIPKNSVFNYEGSAWVADGGVIKTAFNVLHTYKNYIMLDTGYRDNSTDYNKRFRELQLKFNNTGGGDVKFALEFILDGKTRIDKYTYSVEHVTDSTASNYGQIYISRTPVENVELPGTTVLGASASDVNAWTLDNSMFPEISFWKARTRVSGKGYTPRFRLMSRNEERYEVLGYTWVYRMMYSR